ncbi:hypothetical protein ACA910_012247 [Epithemia clementina (nom. ined.)]
MWKEACWFRWRILVARAAAAKIDPRHGGIKDGGGGETKTTDAPYPRMTKEMAAKIARKLVEENQDPIAHCFGTRLWDGQNMLLALFDEQVRSLCPHLQTVQREAYRNVTDDRGAAFGLTLEYTTAKEFFRLFAVMGLQPKHYVMLCEAFIWTMETHNPYAKEDDLEEFEKPPKESVFGRFVAQHVAKPGIKSLVDTRLELATPLYCQLLPEVWALAKDGGSLSVGESFYSCLLSEFPELLDYFARADMDSLAHHIILALDLMVKYPSMVGNPDSSFRTVTKHLGEVHRELGIETDAYPKIFVALLKILKPFFVSFAKTKNKQGNPLKVSQLEDGLALLFADTMSFTFYPMLREEMLCQKATEFLQQAAEELNWSQSQLSKRILQVKLEISSHGTYEHTTEEIELGARLAWRNSVKCVGRISWNTLMVRDCRHVETPGGIIDEIQKHLELATAGTNLQSVMTVFRPRKPDEAWGIRFWSEQLVRYACYEDPKDSSKWIGDRANQHLTDFLITRGLWTPPPPEKRTNHDILPVVFKMPGREKPIVHQFDPKYMDEAPIEHPTNPKIKEMGHRWGTVPVIAAFHLNIGGVSYGAFPFNGWFCSTEIVRDLMERYCDFNERCAEAFGIDVKTHPMYEARVAHELDVAILHSFKKAGYTIVDPKTVAEQFQTHCKREQKLGRECPAQWSWIGGLFGPINKTWHIEMRDFRKEPQYEYCCSMLSVTGEDEYFGDDRVSIYGGLGEEEQVDMDVQLQENFSVPRVLIAYGSETGAAEAAASRLSRVLRLCKPVVYNLNRVAGLEIIKKMRITHMLVLCSTFGKGMPPTNAKKFFKTEIPSDMLGETKVAVLALGSSQYPDFCKAGKDVERILINAGGKKLTPLTTADEAVDSPGTVNQWIKLVKSIVLPQGLETAIEASMSCENEPLRYMMKWSTVSDVNPVAGTVVRPEEESSPCKMNEELLVDGDISSRSTRRIAFDIPPGSSYVTGDHLAVYPLNSMEVVRRFVSCFIKEIELISTEQKVDLASSNVVDWALQQRIEIDCIDNGSALPATLPFDTPITLSAALQESVGLSISESSAADIFGVVLKYLPRGGPALDKDQELKEFVERGAHVLEGGKGAGVQDDMDTLLSKYPTVVDLLETFTPVIARLSKDPIPMAELLAILPRLQPRLYSISSSSIESPDVVEISVGVVHANTTFGVHIAGVCSNYLAMLKPGVDRAKIAIRTSSFRGPADMLKTPMIMVGAGTGLAPMMGFLRDRALVLRQGVAEEECHLFFGCRSHEERIYRDLIEGWENDKVLKLHLAMSRAPDMPKMYVQHKIRDQGEMLYQLLTKDNCTYYVCGDANMADNCYEVLVDVLREYGQMSRAKATLFLKRMRMEERWQYDLWGISAYMDDDTYIQAKKKTAKRQANRAVAWLNRVHQTDTNEDEW